LGCGGGGGVKKKKQGLVGDKQKPKKNILPKSENFGMGGNENNQKKNQGGVGGEGGGVSAKNSRGGEKCYKTKTRGNPKPVEKMNGKKKNGGIQGEKGVNGLFWTP